jgi:cell pole-organizing protein PopZ
MGTVPVKWNHRSGADAVAGYLDNFRIDGEKLLGDWHLLKSHSQYAQAMEMAERMPKNVGLSAAFMGDDEKRDDGKMAARCKELISVDVVANPAANPTGLFSAKTSESVDKPRMKETLMSNHTENNQGAPEPSLADVMAAITTINERLDQQEAIISEQAAQHENNENEEITIEDLLTLTPEQVSQLVAEGHLTEEDAAGIAGLQAEAMAGDGEESEESQEGSEGETAGVGAEASAGEFSALARSVRELSARFAAEDASREDATVEHHFSIIENNLKELSSENISLKELNSNLQSQNEAMRHALRTGIRPLAFSVEGEAITGTAGKSHEFTSLVKKHRDLGKSEAEAIRFAHKENPEAHADYLRNL